MSVKYTLILTNDGVPVYRKEITIDEIHEVSIIKWNDCYYHFHYISVSDAIEKNRRAAVREQSAKRKKA